jgi:hypothetical protein
MRYLLLLLVIVTTGCLHTVPPQYEGALQLMARGPVDPATRIRIHVFTEHLAPYLTPEGYDLRKKMDSVEYGKLDPLSMEERTRLVAIYRQLFEEHGPRAYAIPGASRGVVCSSVGSGSFYTTSCY